MKTIKIDGYPDYFEFKTRVELPVWYQDEWKELDWENMTEEQYINRKNYKAEQVRNRLLIKNMKKLRINSPCHVYEDYIVETVIKTENGEIWHLGS